jgi:hypothetical protein
LGSTCTLICKMQATLGAGSMDAIFLIELYLVEYKSQMTSVVAIKDLEFLNPAWVSGW